MKITAITSYPVKVGFRNQFIVKIDTDEGISGVGEGGMSGRELGMSGMVEHLSRWLIGEDPGRMEHLWQTCYRTAYFEGGNILTAALSAIDIALWDIQGKRFGVPVYQLLGGACRDYLPCFATPGGLDGPEIVAKAKKMYAEGWNVQRFLPVMRSTLKDGESSSEIFEPLEAIDLAAEWLEKIRNEVGTGLNLAIDFHHRLNAAESALFCKRVEHLNLYFLEEPMRSENPRAYQQLRTMTSVPFAIGEEFASPFAFVPWIEDGITNFVRVDLSNVGGYRRAAKWRRWRDALHRRHAAQPARPDHHRRVDPFRSGDFELFLSRIPASAGRRLRSQRSFPNAQDRRAQLPDADRTRSRRDFDHEVAAERAFEFWDAPRWLAGTAPTRIGRPPVEQALGVDGCHGWRTSRLTGPYYLTLKPIGTEYGSISIETPRPITIPRPADRKRTELQARWAVPRTEENVGISRCRAHDWQPVRAEGPQPDANFRDCGLASPGATARASSSTDFTPPAVSRTS